MVHHHTNITVHVSLSVGVGLLRVRLGTVHIQQLGLKVGLLLLK